MHSTELYLFITILIVSILLIISASKEGSVDQPPAKKSNGGGCIGGQINVRKSTKNPEKGQSVKLLKVVDGDTVHVEMDGQKVSVRLANIDSPESSFYGKKQKYGEESKANLEKLCGPYLGKMVTLKACSGRDKHGRVGGNVYVNGVDCSTYQVRTGFAWVYTQYNRDPSLLEAQEQARKKRVGLWTDSRPIYPQDWRKQQKGKAA